jgi:hypothetical protein
MVSRGVSGVKPAKCKKIVNRMNGIEILLAKFLDMGKGDD